MAKKLTGKSREPHRTGEKIRDWDNIELVSPPLTDHARTRLESRAISEEQIQRVVDCGREVHERHATVYFVGSREIAKDKTLEECDGVHVICAPNGSAVITAYRNKTYRLDRSTSNQKPRWEKKKRRYGK